VLALAFVFLLPFLEVFRYSLTDWQGGVREANYIGVANYLRVFKDERFLSAIQHNITLLLVIPIEVVLATLTASFLREKVVGWRFYRFVVFVPAMISITIVGYVWTYFLSPMGVFNIILRAIGLGEIARPWLADKTFALVAIMFVLIWRDSGFATLLFYSQLLGVSEEVYDCAKIDGANRLQRILFVEAPSLTGIMSIFAVMMTIWLFAFVFNYVFVMTGGGPGYASSVLEFEIYKNAFKFSQFGYGSAMAVLLVLITSPIIAVQIARQLRRRSAT
jgi:ABC-type sugar transport system permease subunit